MKNIHKILIAIGTVVTLFFLTASLTHASLTPVSWIRDTVAGFIRPGILTDTLRIPSLTNCDTIDTDADGDFACGTDSGGGGSGDITAVGDVTTGDAFTGTAGTELIFNNAGGDGIFNYDGTDFNFDKSISLGTAGVRLSGDGDGAITFRGLGNGSDEDLTLNLDDTSNVGTFSSSTGLSRLSYSNIEQQDGGNAWKLAYNNSSYFGNGSGAILRTGFGGVTSPSAKIHIGAGATGANTAPLMFTAGTNMTTPQAGAVEFDGTDLFYTDSTPTRQTVANVGDLASYELLSNKSTDTNLGNSNTLYPTQRAVQTYVDAGLSLRELSSNKENTTIDTSTTKYPTVNLLKTGLDAKLNTSAYDDADASEVNTGTSTAKYISPDSLAGSYAGSKELVVNVLERNYTVTTGDRKACVTIPSTMNGMNIVEVGANVYTKSSSGTPTIQIARGRQSSATSAPTFVDVLKTRITIDANEYDSKDATSASVIDTANDDLAMGDLICGDVDVTGTGTKGLSFRVVARLP